MGGVAWTEEEDHLLKKCIEQYGEGKWHRVPVLAGLNRCRKSCRLRWLNYLRPNIRRGTFTDDEVLLILKLHNHLGNRWSLIASRLSGRTANDVKNFWNCHLSKKLDKLNQNENPTSFASTDEQATFSAHHSFRAITGISTTGSTDPQDDKKRLELGVALSRHGATSINCQRGGCADGENVVNEFASKFEFGETSLEGGGHFNSMDRIWDWDELIFDMDLWG